MFPIQGIESSAGVCVIFCRIGQLPLSPYGVGVYVIQLLQKEFFRIARLDVRGYFKNTVLLLSGSFIWGYMASQYLEYIGPACGFQSFYHLIGHKTFSISKDGIDGIFAFRDIEEQMKVIGHNDKTTNLMLILNEQVEPLVNRIVKIGDFKKRDPVQTGEGAEIGLLHFWLVVLYGHQIKSKKII